MKKYIAALLFCFFVAGNVNATIFVPSYGSSGPQSYSYTFGNDFDGDFIIGIANEGDDLVSSYLSLTNFGGYLSGIPDMTLDSSGSDDMSGYLNTKGEAGTNGEFFSYYIDDVWAGETVSFDWLFTTDDYEPYNDFAFVELVGSSGKWCCNNDWYDMNNGGYDDGFYEVIAEISDEVNVTEPSVLALLGLGLVGIGLARRKNIH